MTTTLLAPSPTTATTADVLDVVVEDVSPGRVRLTSHVPARTVGADPRLQLLERATTATLRSVVGRRHVDTLAEQVLGLADLPAGTAVEVEGALVTRGRRTVAVRAQLRDELGRPCGQSITTVSR
jgi:hypothetical protein